MGSIRVKNLALLLKWRWRWLKEEDSLWARVVASTNRGVSGLLKFGREPERWSVRKGINNVAGVEGLGNEFKKLFKCDVGMRNNTLFLEDEWVGERALKAKFKWLNEMEEHKSCSVEEKIRWDEG